MTRPTCAEVEQHLLLHAAGESRAEEAALLEQHLRVCSRCTRELANIRQLLGLLELTLAEPERLQRIRDRIGTLDNPSPPMQRFLPWARTWVALAAMLFLALGLAAFLPSFPTSPPAQATPLELALCVTPEDVPLALARGGPPPSPPTPVVTREAPWKDAGLSAAEFRALLHEAEATDRLPLPPRAELAVELRNTTGAPLRVAVAGPFTEVRLDLQGPGAVQIRAPTTPPQETGTMRTILLSPGESHIFPLRQLEDSGPQGRHFWYWTEPGTYRLRAAVSTMVKPVRLGEEGQSGLWRQVTLQTEPAMIRVEPE